MLETTFDNTGPGYGNRRNGKRISLILHCGCEFTVFFLALVAGA